MSRNGRQATQRASALWSRVHSGIRMLCLLMIGVIALGVAANAAPGKRQFHRASSAPRPVAMEQIVAVGSSVYALAADHQAVYEWSEHQSNWLKVKGAAQKLYAGGGNVYAIEPGSGDISKYDAKNRTWPRIGGPGATFAATSKHLYGVSPDHSGLWRYSGGGDVWNKVGERSETLYAGADDAVYVTNPDDKKIFKYDGRWTPVADTGATFAVTDNNLYRLTADRGAIEEYNPKKNKWNAVGGPAENIFASNTLYKTMHGTGDLYKYNSNKQWNRIGGRAADFATSGHYLYRLAPDHRSVQKYAGDGRNDKWDTLGAPAAGTAPSAGAKAARYTQLTQSGPDGFKAFKAAREEHLRGVPDRYAFRWSTNYCNAPAPNNPLGFKFTDACIRHDFGYRNYRDMYGEKAFRNNPDGKRRIDGVFQADMELVCRTSKWEDACLTVAGWYVSNVEWWG
ncbi:phospholipase A2 [Streptomyces sp. NPDC059193]|uniref:phospholipase A2 n=1 Tax=Streptomyces sp. NPDC059193 TaxID=3346763 RepID=UPI0036AE7A54